MMEAPSAMTSEAFVERLRMECLRTGTSIKEMFARVEADVFMAKPSATDAETEALVDQLETAPAEAPVPAGERVTQKDVNRWIASALVFRLADHLEGRHPRLSEELAAIATRTYNRSRDALRGEASPRKGRR
jgi:hypothetical protein